MQSNDMAGIKFRQPKDFAERFGVAEQCSIRLDMKSPVLIDNIANTTCEDYAAFPDRLYVVDMDGKVAYKGGRGPFGYKPREMEQALLLLMMEAQMKARKKTVTTKKDSRTTTTKTNPTPPKKSATAKPVPPVPPTPPGPDLPQTKLDKADSKNKKDGTQKPSLPKKKSGKPPINKIVDIR